MQSHKIGQSLQRFTDGNETKKFLVSQRTKTNSKLPLHIPDSFARNDISAKFTIHSLGRFSGRKHREQLLSQIKPLSVELMNFGRNAEIISQNGLQ